MLSNEIVLANMPCKVVLRETIRVMSKILISKLKTIVNKRKKRLWVRKWISRRNEFGASATLLKELALESKEEYLNHLRMTEEKFNELLGKVQDSIRKCDTVMRKSIPPTVKLHVTLRYLATRDSLASLQGIHFNDKLNTKFTRFKISTTTNQLVS